MDIKMIVKNYIESIIDACGNIDQSEISDIYKAMIATNEAGGKIYICGNGGSASTALHFQTDLNMAFSISKNTMPAYCLTDNVSTLTAISNDFSYDDVFLHQLRFLLNESDMLIVISCSGNSVNVIKAAEYAKQKGNTVVSLVGFDGGKLKTLSDYSFHISVHNMQISEDMHLMFCHLISTMIRESHGTYNAQH